MDASIRMLRILQIAMLVSIALYILVGERVGSVRQLSDPTIFYVLSMVTVTIVGVILVVRRTLVAHSAGILRDRPNDGTTLGRWRAGYVMLPAANNCSGTRDLEAYSERLRQQVVCA